MDLQSKNILIASIIEVEEAIDDQVNRSQFNTAEALFWLNQERVDRLDKYNDTRPGDSGTKPPKDGE